jgi:uncharacterized protein (TIGR03083 family)
MFGSKSVPSVLFKPKYPRNREAAAGRVSDLIELQALRGETERLIEFLRSLKPSDWARPTRCSPLNMRALLGHILSSYVALERVSIGPGLSGEPDQDCINWWIYDREEIGRWVLSEATQQPDIFGEADPTMTFIRRSRAALDRCEERLGVGDLICRPFFASIRLSEFVATRVVEVCIHTMDLRNAVALDADPTQAGLNMTLDVLEGLLGGPAPLDDLRLVLVGSGREALTEGEEQLLGPVHSKFPLLA